MTLCSTTTALAAAWHDRRSTSTELHGCGRAPPTAVLLQDDLPLSIASCIAMVRVLTGGAVVLRPPAARARRAADLGQQDGPVSSRPRRSSPAALLAPLRRGPDRVPKMQPSRKGFQARDAAARHVLAFGRRPTPGYGRQQGSKSRTTWTREVLCP